ncbi:hypothetical protein R3P38DRAFT_2808240 [Favolaschia claudopus]|uniref:Uncharacterized protein n=1 Tax=Favolaschia claudopus TaxID=2862362 RepID=A0AAV9ZGA8_9AGAR
MALQETRKQAKLDACKIFELYEPLLLGVLSPEDNPVDASCAAFAQAYAGNTAADIIELCHQVQKVRCANTRDRNAEMRQVRLWIKQCSDSHQQSGEDEAEAESRTVLLFEAT